jgi:hypothetical protein
MDQKEQAKYIMDLVHMCALRVLECPHDEREENYIQLTQQNYEHARSSGMEDKTAAETALRIEGLIRSMVGLIEQGGGKQGTA